MKGIIDSYTPPEPPKLPESYTDEDLSRGYNQASLCEPDGVFSPMKAHERREERKRLRDLYGGEPW